MPRRGWRWRMIARIWTAAARPDCIAAYVTYLREKTFPQLRSIPGHRGAYVLRRPSNDDLHVTVITLWESLDAVARFSGADVEAAVVPPEAQALLISWDARATHWDVAYATDGPAKT